MSNLRLDHFAWSWPNLDTAIDDFEDRTGVRPMHGGSHPGMGTRNALVTLGPKLYLAIDGPDPEQELVDNNGARFAAQDGPDLFLFAMAARDLEQARKIFESFGVTAESIAGSRRTRAGKLLEWDFLRPGPHGFGCALPHISRWRTDAHPTEDAPQGCRLVDFRIGFPDPDKLRILYDALGVDLRVYKSEKPELRAVLQGAKEPIELLSR